MSTSIATVPVPEHPLLSREMRAIRNWGEFLTTWNASTRFDEMLGLLHTGFSVIVQPHPPYGEPKSEEADRLAFYFSVADSWNDDSPMNSTLDKNEKYQFKSNTRGGWVLMDTIELRERVARKAFDMLCQTLFKTELENPEWSIRGHERFRDEWLLVTSNRVLPLLQNFFRPEKKPHREEMCIRNLPARGREHSHHRQVTERFLLNLVTFVWEWREPITHRVEEDGANAEIRARLDSAKPWMIEILSAFDQTDFLRKRLLELDQPCLDKLLEIALRNELKSYQNPVKESRPVATLEEACYLGSRTGLLLKEYRLKRREHKRLQTILEAERAKEAADHRLTKLMSS